MKKSVMDMVIGTWVGEANTLKYTDFNILIKIIVYALIETITATANSVSARK